MLINQKANATEWLSLVLSNNLHCDPHANVGNRRERFNVFTFVIEKNFYEEFL